MTVRVFESTLTPAVSRWERESCAEAPSSAGRWYRRKLRMRAGIGRPLDHIVPGNQNPTVMDLVGFGRSLSINRRARFRGVLEGKSASE